MSLKFNLKSDESFPTYLNTEGKPSRFAMKVEGMIDGKVVASEYKVPAINGKEIKCQLLHPGPNTIQGGEIELESKPSNDLFLQSEIGTEISFNKK